MGANPNKPDIFVEVDWMATHRPKPEAIEKIVQSFANAPVYDNAGNLVGTGINLHVDVGPDSIDYVTGRPWGENGKGNEIPDYVEIINLDEQVSVNQLNQLINGNFVEARNPIFHYSLWIHKLLVDGKLPSGISFISSEDEKNVPVFLVALGAFSNNVGSLNEQAGTFMHELGHNLGLQHGGDQIHPDDIFNHKPNYLSVMNYSFIHTGLIIHGTDGCDECFDYSRFTLPNLNEAELYEGDGLNGGDEADRYGTKYRRSSPWLCWPFEELPVVGYFSVVHNGANNQIDWSCDHTVATNPVQEDINGLGGNTQILTGYNDWSNIDLNYAHRLLRPSLESKGITIDLSSALIIDPSDRPIELTIEDARTIPSISETRAQVIGSVDQEWGEPLDVMTYSVTVYTVDFGSIESFTPTVSLPNEFSYIQNSTTGDINVNPTISGNRLIWPAVEIIDNTVARQFYFQVQVGVSHGTFTTDISGMSSTGLVLPDQIVVEIKEFQADSLFLPLVNN